MANKLTKTVVASSNAQQVNPVRVVQNPKKEAAEFDNGDLQENKTVDVSEKKNGINLTLVPPRQLPVTEKIKTAAVENIIVKDEVKEKESQQEFQSSVLLPDTSFATPRAEAELNNAQKNNSLGLLMEDSAGSLQLGQMRKTAFLELLRAEITKTIEPILKTVGQTTKDCPYMNYWLDLYHQKDAIHIEQTVKKYAPDSIGATSAEEYISIVTQRALRAAAIWAKTGRLTGIPPGVPTTIPEQAPTRSQRAVLTKAKTGGARVTDPHAIQEQLGEGQPLSSDIRSRMETAFGTNFQHVRSHTDATAGSLATTVNARAFTVGNHVAFGAGEYKPGTIMGDALIAHELAHTIQQNQPGSEINSMQTGNTNYNALEKDADLAAEKVVMALWQAENGSKKFGKRLMPDLKSGLSLQRCSRSSTPAQTTTPLRAPDTCPTSVELESTQNMTPGGLDLGYRTGYGIMSVMHLLPDTTDWSSAQVFERVSLANTTCPEAWDMCTGGNTPFPINQSKYSTVLGDLPARRNRFYDFHTSRWNRSRLHDSEQNPTGMDSCTVTCNQSYVCNDGVIGRFVITRNFRKVMHNGREVTEVNTTKAPA